MRMTQGDKIFYPFIAALCDLLNDDHVLHDHTVQENWVCITYEPQRRAVTIRRDIFDIKIDYLDAAGNNRVYKVTDPKKTIVELINFLSGKEPNIK